jgi:hypothetical protein
LHRTETVGQRAHGIAVDGRRVEEPPLALVLVLHLLHLDEVGAYLADTVGEVLDALEERPVFQVSKDFMAVVHGVDVVELLVEEGRDEIALLSISGDRRDDLVEVQVGRVGGSLLLPGGRRPRRSVE